MANPEWDNYNPSKCKRCDGSGNEPNTHSDLPEPGSGKWYSQSYVDDLNARLEATQKANGASVISSASPLSEDERERLVEAVCSARYQKNHAKGERLRREWNETYEERLVRLIDRLSASAPSPEDKGKMSGDERLLRQMVWLSHGCVGIYGDDGEMQCGSCRIDFKREPVEQIDARLQRIRYERLAAARVTEGRDPGGEA